MTLEADLAEVERIIASVSFELSPARRQPRELDLADEEDLAGDVDREGPARRGAIPVR